MLGYDMLRVGRPAPPVARPRRARGHQQPGCPLLARCASAHPAGMPALNAPPARAAAQDELALALSGSWQNVL